MHINKYSMAKEKEMKLAKILYVEQGKTAKEISALVNVSEATLSKWVINENWKTLRNAFINKSSNRIDNIQQIISDLSEQRLDLGRKLKEAETKIDIDEIERLRGKIAQVDDAVSKWNKTLLTIDKENQVSLSAYLAVMEMVFDAMKAFDQKLYLQSLDFQEAHLNEVSLRFK